MDSSALSFAVKKTLVEAFFYWETFRKKVLETSWHNLAASRAGVELVNVFDGLVLGQDAKLQRFFEALDEEFRVDPTDVLEFFLRIFSLVYPEIPIPKQYGFPEDDKTFDCIVLNCLGDLRLAAIPLRPRHGHIVPLGLMGPNMQLEATCRIHLNFEEGVFQCYVRFEDWTSSGHPVNEDEALRASLPNSCDLVFFTAPGQRTFRRPEVLSLRALRVLAIQGGSAAQAELLVQSFVRNRTDPTEISVRRLLALASLVREDCPGAWLTLAACLFDTAAEWGKLTPEDKLACIHAAAHRLLRALCEAMTDHGHVMAHTGQFRALDDDDLAEVMTLYLREDSRRLMLWLSVLDFNASGFDFSEFELKLFTSRCPVVLQASFVPNVIREAVRALDRAARQFVLGHSSASFSTWCLQQFSSKDARRFVLLGSRHEAWHKFTRFNFHEAARGAAPGDAWSTVLWAVTVETPSGVPATNLAITFDISDAQAATLGRLDRALQRMLADREPDSQLGGSYRSVLMGRSQRRAPKVTLNFRVSASPEHASLLGTMYYYKLSEDGQTHVPVPAVARGWSEVEPLIRGHGLRGATIRVQLVDVVGLVVVNKLLYPSIDIVELAVREPLPCPARAAERLSLPVCDAHYWDDAWPAFKFANRPRDVAFCTTPPALEFESMGFNSYFWLRPLSQLVLLFIHIVHNAKTYVYSGPKADPSMALFYGLVRYRARSPQTANAYELLECLVNNGECGELLWRRLQRRTALRQASGLWLEPLPAVGTDGAVAAVAVPRICLACLDAMTELTIFWQWLQWSGLPVREAPVGNAGALLDLGAALGLDYVPELLRLKRVATAVLERAELWQARDALGMQAVKRQRQAVVHAVGLSQSYRNLTTAFLDEPYLPDVDGLRPSEAGRSRPAPLTEAVAAASHVPDLEAVIAAQNDTARRAKVRTPQATPPARPPTAAARPAPPAEAAPRLTRKEQRKAQAQAAARRRAAERQRELDLKFLRDTAPARENVAGGELAGGPSVERAEQVLGRRLRKLARDERLAAKGAQKMSKMLPRGVVAHLFVA